MPNSRVSHRVAIASAALFLFAAPVVAQTEPFTSGWTLTPDASALKFQSVKNETKVETSSFATLAGAIDDSGTATVKVALDSVDTTIDLRNVRMRFLLFETFQFPEATITVDIDPEILSDLPRVRRKTVTLPFTMSLHGVSKDGSAEVAITLLGDDLVSVASATPVSVATSDYDLDGGVAKLEEAAGVKIVPSATVSFDFMFTRNTPTATTDVAAAAPAPVSTPTPTPIPVALPDAPASLAVETTGNFDLEACVGRFEILSRTDNINFRSGSAVLDDGSAFLLDSIIDIVRRCPGLRVEVSGHTDSLGGASANLRLSQRRAASVTQYLENNGVDPAQLLSVGLGETRPIADNETRDGQRRNRRIEFKVING